MISDFKNQDHPLMNFPVKQRIRPFTDVFLFGRLVWLDEMKKEDRKELAMNENILDWLETDDFDTFDEGLEGEYLESPFEGEDFDTEFYGEFNDAESRASRRRAAARRAAQVRRRRALAARQRARMRGRSAPNSRRLPASSSTSEGREIQKAQEGVEKAREGIEKAREGIEKVELENQVQSDVFGRAIIKQQQRIGRNEHALAASIVRGEIERYFPDLVKEPALQSALALLPNAMLGFGRGAKGIEGVLTHPAVWSAIATLGIAVVARAQKQTLVVKMATPQITMTSAMSEIGLAAFVADKDGNRISNPPQITWESSNPTVASVDQNGRVKRGSAAGTENAFITASAPGAQSGTTTVIVEPLASPLF
jgi:hypothetical protein